MNDEAAFLAAIRAAPGDDAPRLIYADWLEERGDGRAEFVRLQHQLAMVLGRLQHLQVGLDQEWVQSVQVTRDVVIHGFAPERLREVTKLIRMHTGLDLQGARALLAQQPTTVVRDLSLERAERVRQDLAVVADVTIEPCKPSK